MGELLKNARTVIGQHYGEILNTNKRRLAPEDYNTFLETYKPYLDTQKQFQKETTSSDDEDVFNQNIIK